MRTLVQSGLGVSTLPALPTLAIEGGGGNGGLSLRRRSSLLKVATRGSLPQSLWGEKVLQADNSHIPFQPYDHNAYFADDDLHNNSKTRWFEDDLQISYKLSKLRLLPPGSVMSRFSIAQALPSSGIQLTSPVGMHKTWLTPLIEPETIIDLLQVPFDRIAQS